MRDLNKEYKDMVLSETPDIWSKIESGLDERQRAAGPRPVVAAPASAVQPQTAAAPKRKIVRMPRVMKYAGAAVAAVVCICIVIPLLQGSKSATTAESSAPRHIRSESAAADGAAPAAVAEMAEAVSAAEEAASDTAGSQTNARKQVNSYTATADNAEMSFDHAKQNEGVAEEAYEAADAEAMPEGERLIRITLAAGADIDSIRYIIWDFALTWYDEYDDTYVFVIPEGIDITELMDVVSKETNIAEVEVTPDKNAE